MIDVVLDDIEEMMQKHAKNPGQMKSKFKQIKKIGFDQIIFVMKLIENQEDNFGKIETVMDLFLITLQQNLAFQSGKETSFSKLLNDEEKGFSCRHPAECGVL